MLEKPNIIFILIDDMGWKDLSCYGSKYYETPNIDNIASDGMMFTDAYAAAPVCSPTRASILTGKYPATLGLTNFIPGGARGKLIESPFTQYLPLSEICIAKKLKENGYSTWHVGKWHLGESPYFPENHGFDINIGGCSWGMPMYGYFSPWNIPNLKDMPKGTYLTDHLTDKAIELIRKKDDNPFFLNLWYYSVHIPIQAKREITRYYKEKRKNMGLDKVKTFELGDNFPCEHKKNYRIKRRLVQSNPKYAAMIHSLDENIGRILATIDEIGENDNTVVVFTSDNGGLATAESSPICNLPLSEGKGWMYEGGTREPLIVKWPNHIARGSVCNVPVTSPDFYPTILEIAGITPIESQTCEGVSLLPLFKGNNNLTREGIFWHYPHYGNQGGTPCSSIRLGDFKYIRFYEDDHTELYNLRKDIGERNDLSEVESEKKEHLNNIMQVWLSKIRAKFPEKNSDYKS